MAKKIITFKEKETEDVGVWEFIIEEDEFSNYLEKKPVYGKGTIKYGEGSIYTGDIYFDGINFNKLGHGEQNFLKSSLNNFDAGGKENTILYKYIGEYDYRKGDWICGLGTIYFLNKDLKPDSFIHGEFLGLECLKEIKINKKSELLEGFLPEMQIKQECHKDLLDKFIGIQNKSCKYLFIGDSYFEFMYDKFARFHDAINLGIGGAKFINFLKLKDDILSKFKAENIILNLGFNDIHSGFKNRAIENRLNKLLSFFFDAMKVNHVYILNIVPAPNFTRLIEIEEDFNNYLFRKSKNNKNISVIDACSLFYKDNKYVSDYDSLFAVDKVHLNDTGYERYLNLIQKSLNN